MTEPTRIIPKDGVGPYRNFTSDFEAIRARALHAWQCRFNKELPWPNIKDDALYLAILVQTLVEEKLDMAERLSEYQPKGYRPIDLCPCCGGDTWSRPAPHQFEGDVNTHRECNVCRWVRPDPRGENELELQPIKCQHDQAFPINGFTDSDGETIDAVDYCPCCNEVRIWGMGWGPAPTPSAETKERLDALCLDPRPCKACFTRMGEAPECPNVNCPSFDSDEEPTMTETPDNPEQDDYLDQWNERSRLIAHQLLEHLEKAPIDLMIQGKRFKVEVRKYSEGPDVDTDGLFGMVLVSGEREHMDFGLKLTGWGTVSPMEAEDAD